MSDTKQYIEKLLSNAKISIPQNRKKILEDFIIDEVNINAVKQIKEIQKAMTDKMILKLKIQDIIDSQLQIPNGTVGKLYEAKLDLSKIAKDIAHLEFEKLEEDGLEYDASTTTIKGCPTQSGDFKICMKFRVIGEVDDSELNVKQMSLVINADPKSLWKNIPSTKTENNYWKPDSVNDFQPLGNKHIVVASKRGRSHANVGSFRDDNYAFKHFENSGWSIVCVADGAGSAKLSREGSRIACDGIVDYFENNFNDEVQLRIDSIVNSYYQLSIAPKKEWMDGIIESNKAKVEENNNQVETANSDEGIGKILNPLQDAQKEISNFLYQNLGNAAFAIHKKLEETATKIVVPLKDFHSTLIFALYKKYEFGYAILTFGVGDCPIGLLNKDLTEIKLMNWLDVGEFGGGTRFITMPEIFSSDKFSTRFGFKLIEDFSYLMLMTDGIYDPKFVVEASLEKLEKWKEFLQDLDGNNEEKNKVEFNPQNIEIANQLSTWMDFWSAGNHDDRTLAIVF